MKLALIFGLIAVAIVCVSGQECGPHEYFSTCVPFPECQRSCTYPDPPFCSSPPECDVGAQPECSCVEDHLRDHLGYCVPYGHC